MVMRMVRFSQMSRHSGDVDKIINEMAYPNAITSTLLEMVKIPFWTPNDRLAVQAAVKTCAVQIK